jgi:hypothetical protein
MAPGAAAGVAEKGKAMADFFLLCLKRAAVRWEVGRLDDDRLQHRTSSLALAAV